MALGVETPLLTEEYNAPYRQALVWVDAMLHDAEVDVQRREALAREHHQETVSLVLNAQGALLVRLRDRVHSHYWALRNGTAPKME